MGLEILLFRDEETLRLVRESQRRRYADPKTVDDVVDADKLWRRLQFLAESTKKFVNDCSRTIADKKKGKNPDGDDLPLPESIKAEVEEGNLQKESLMTLSVVQLKSFSKWIQEKGVALSKQASDAESLRDQLLINVGNIVHESVPVEIDEEKGNTTVRTFGDCFKKPSHLLMHVDIMEKLGALECGKSVTSMAGGRAYVLKGPLVQLQLALLTYGMAFMVSKGYVPFYPPFFMNKEVMGEVAQLSQFDDELYKVTGDGEEKYLIVTSEMPLVAYHRGKWFGELPTPLKYAGMSTCFRKEAGAHGRDTRGIFRVHQFDKLEQFVVCSPRDGESWRLLEEMILTSEDFCKSLGLPYRVINICSGALNNAAAKKYDLEAFFPASEQFRELVSCSNCTDYQARGVSCRYGPNLKGTSPNSAKDHPHMLNGTLCAVTRTMCCICENFQTDEGVKIPDVLKPFMLGREMLRYDEAPKQ